MGEVVLVGVIISDDKAAIDAAVDAEVELAISRKNGNGSSCKRSCKLL